MTVLTVKRVRGNTTTSMYVYTVGVTAVKASSSCTAQPLMRQNALQWRTPQQRLTMQLSSYSEHKIQCPSEILSCCEIALYTAYKIFMYGLWKLISKDFSGIIGNKSCQDEVRHFRQCTAHITTWFNFKDSRTSLPLIQAQLKSRQRYIEPA